MKRTKRVAATAFAAILAGAFWCAQSVRAQHAGHDDSLAGWVPREILERPVPLRQGIGTVHEKVTTQSAQGQAFYDQGLAYLHSFVWIEAARSFHQALRLDPGLAMAYVGLSDAYIGFGDLPDAHAAVAKAQELAASASDAERRKIEIRARLLEWFDSGGDLQKYFAYRSSITDAIAHTPDDPWLWIQRGFADEGVPHGHGQNGGADTIAFYQTAIKLAPDDFPAHHYLAHTYETLGLTELALAQSDIYARAVPAIPHAHHMRGHDLRRLGRTEEALAEFERADELEESYYRAEKIPAQYDWHHFHNLTLLAMCNETLGQMKLAEKRLREAFDEPVHNDLAEFNRRAWPEFLLDRGRNEEALSAAQPLIDGTSAMGRFAGHAAAGRALLGLGRVDEAQSELSQAERELEHVPSTAAGELTDAALLRAELLARQGKMDASDKLFRQLVAKIRALPGPDSWSEALFQLEAIAAAARDGGQWDLAEFTAQQMIEHDPTYAGGHYLLGLAAEHAGNSAAAQKEFQRAEAAWAKADPDLPERVRVRQLLAQSQKP